MLEINTAKVKDELNQCWRKLEPGWEEAEANSFFTMAKREVGDDVYEMTGKTFVIGVLLAMPVGIPTLTEDNLDEAYERISSYEKVVGTMFKTSPDRPPYYITREDLETHVGLITNGSPRTKKSFNRVLTDHLAREAKLMKEQQDAKTEEIATTKD